MSNVIHLTNVTILINSTNITNTWEETNGEIIQTLIKQYPKKRKKGKRNKIWKKENNTRKLRPFRTNERERERNKQTNNDILLE